MVDDELFTGKMAIRAIYRPEGLRELGYGVEKMHAGGSVSRDVVEARPQIV